VGTFNVSGTSVVYPAATEFDPGNATVTLGSGINIGTNATITEGQLVIPQTATVTLASGVAVLSAEATGTIRVAAKVGLVGAAITGGTDTTLTGSTGEIALGTHGDATLVLAGDGGILVTNGGKITSSVTGKSFALIGGGGDTTDTFTNNTGSVSEAGTVITIGNGVILGLLDDLGCASVFTLGGSAAIYVGTGFLTVGNTNTVGYGIIIDVSNTNGGILVGSSTTAGSLTIAGGTAAAGKLNGIYARLGGTDGLIMSGTDAAEQTNIANGTASAAALSSIAQVGTEAVEYSGTKSITKAGTFTVDGGTFTITP